MRKYYVLVEALVENDAKPFFGLIRVDANLIDPTDRDPEHAFKRAEGLIEECEGGISHLSPLLYPETDFSGFDEEWKFSVVGHIVVDENAHEQFHIAVTLTEGEVAIVATQEPVAMTTCLYDMSTTQQIHGIGLLNARGRVVKGRPVRMRFLEAEEVSSLMAKAS
jgi:hypothetical protein